MTVKSVVLPAFFKETTHSVDALCDRIEKVHTDAELNGVEFYFDGTETENNRVKKLLYEKDMYSVFLAAFPMKARGISLLVDSEAEQKSVLSQMKHFIDLAYFFGSKEILILSGENNQIKLDAIVVNTITAVIKELCQYATQKAKEYVLDIALEVFNDKGEPWQFVGPADRAVKIAEEVREKYNNFHLIFDLSHSIQLRENPITVFKKFMPYMTHYHLANCVINDPDSQYFGDKHPPFGVSGSEVDLRYLINFQKAAADSAFFIKKNVSVIGLEVITPKGMDADAVFNEARSVFLKALS